MNIICLNKENRLPVDEYIREEWGGPMLVTLGNLYDSRLLPGYAVLEDGQITGAVLYRISGEECEIAVLYSLNEGRGIGTALINQVISAARENGCHRIWLVTSNDNTHAIRFYQKFGFRLKEVHINSFDLIRRLKPGIPQYGIDGIPLAHEFEFEFLIQN